MKFTFRAYGVEESRELVMNAVESALEQFKYCDEIQIEITAPARGPADMPESGEKRSRFNSAKTVVKGFAG